LLAKKKHPEIDKIVRNLSDQDPLKIQLKKGYLGYTNEFKFVAWLEASVAEFAKGLGANKISLWPAR